jgi:phosphate transport system permease protein
MGKQRQIADTAARKVMLLVTVSCGLLVLLIAGGLIFKAWPILALKPVSDLLFSSAWQPLKGEFGFLSFIMGTLWVTGVAVIVAVPISLFTAIYLSEYAGRRVRAFMGPLIDLLAGIPSVVYGVWGVLLIVPFVKDHVAPFFGTFSTGYTVLTAGVVLAVMIFPVIISVCVEVFNSIPAELREASLSLGATRWQTVKHVVLRRALPGIIAANVLGLSRAFGETMAVLMVAGNVVALPRTVLDPAYPLPALIANNYGEMMSIPLYDSALMLAALILFGVVLVFSVVSRLVLIRVERRMG